MYYTKIKVDNQIYQLSKTYNKQSLRNCVKINFSKLMDDKELMYCLNSFDAICFDPNLYQLSAHNNGGLVCLIYGVTKDETFKCEIFSWNHMYGKYSKKVFRALSIEAFKDLNKKGVNTFILPVLKKRHRSKIYQNLLKKAFPEMERDESMDTEELEFFKINLIKIV